MTDTIAEGFARERAHRQLLIDLARHLFGWEWRQEWQAWCPPGWPSLEVIHSPYMDKRHVLQRHGGAAYGSSGRRDGRGRPVIPDYCCDPEATESLGLWLHAQPGIQSSRFVPLPVPPDSLCGVQPWRCEMVAEPHRLMTGAGATHRVALCYAVLALAPPRRVGGLGGGAMRPPYRLQLVVRIDLIPAPSPAQGELVMERLACGHEGACHGPTWSGTAAPVRRRVAQYTRYIGTRRRCARCASVGQEERYG